MSDDYSFNVKRRRPEEIYDNIRDYYSEEEISRYSMSKSIMRIQRKIILRALELLELTHSNLLIMDAGCGPGFTTNVIRKQGHHTIALDFIAQSIFEKCPFLIYKFLKIRIDHLKTTKCL